MNKKKSIKLIIFGYLFALIVSIVVFILIKNEFNLIVSTLIANITMTFVIFIFSIITNNSSFYDPYWSVIPPIIVLNWIYHTDSKNILSYLILFGILFWGIRLTRNWYINFKGFTHEDFRYQDFRKKFKKLYWPISFFGIHLFPTLIVYLALYPIHYVFSNTINNPLYIYIGVLVMLLGSLISYYGDLELMNHKIQKKSNSVKSGIWKYSRHPNYLGELTNWFGVFVVTLSIGFQPQLAFGFIAMVLLFELYSIPKMEKKLIKNKDDYQIIIDTIPRLIPWRLITNKVIKIVPIKDETKEI